jgi:hypothetical protein
MSLRRWITSAWSVRRALRALDRIGTQLERQNDLLSRLADHVAPSLPAVQLGDVATQSGLDHLDEIELGLALAYAEKLYAATGHEPDDDEILTYLADEKTVDLHSRLAQREREIDQRGRRIAGTEP